MKRFQLIRDEDESGVSGVGLIAEGVEFSNGKCCLNWLTKYASLGLYDDLDTMMEIHGHGGKTRLQWVD